jgi:hypothetical protein
MSVLVGSVEVFALPDVFRLLGNNKVTGALRVLRESGEGLVYFREGRVYYAHSNLTRELIGQRLVNAKLITQVQLLRILDEQKRSGNRRIGHLFVEKGIVAQDLLDTFLREQMQEVIFDILHWDVGRFRFEASEVSEHELGLSLRVENLIMESSRRIDEWEVIRRKLPSVGAIVRLSPMPPPDRTEISVKPEEWSLLALADGKTTVKDMAAASERSEFDACKVVYGLISAGLLEVVSSPESGTDELPSRIVIAKLKPEEGSADAQAKAGEGQPQQEVPSPDVSPVPAASPANAPAVAAGLEAPVAEAPEQTEAKAQAQKPALPRDLRERPSRPVAGDGSKTPQRHQPSVSKKSVGDPELGKELLQRLIEGVRKL